MPRAVQTDIIPPVKVANTAAKGLKLREKFGRGGTDVGLKRARELAAREAITPDDIIAISSYFKRHKVDKKAKSHDWGELSNPSAGYIAWLLWGGDAGEGWADAMKIKLAKAANAKNR
jgi:hypothetical protein